MADKADESSPAAPVAAAASPASPSPSPPAASAAAAASKGEPQDHKSKNLNLLLTRVKEKLAALQGEHERQGKKLSDLEAAHSKLQSSHTALQNRSKSNEEQLHSKLSQAIHSAQSEKEALQAKMQSLKSDMHRSASAMQSNLQEQICSMQAELTATQAALATAQSTLDSERTRLQDALAQTTNDLKDSRLQNEEGLAELRRERENLMRTQYALSDKVRELESSTFRGKRLDERLTLEVEQMQLMKQHIARLEHAAESWRYKFVSASAAKVDMRRSLTQYKTLLKYAAIATWAQGFRMKKLLLTVHDKLGALCAQAIREDTEREELVKAHRQAVDKAQNARAGVKEIRASRRASAGAGTDRELSPLGSAAPVAPPLLEHAPSRLVATSFPSPPVRSSNTGPSAVLADLTSKIVSAQSQSGTAPAPAPSAAPSGTVSSPPLNLATLPRYNALRGGLTEREWEVHVSELARRIDLSSAEVPSRSGASGCAGHGKISNYKLLLVIEERLNILGPVVAELRGEVLSSRSTSEGMFQRTLQLSRKNLSLHARVEKERARVELLREKQELAERELRKLRRIEYMFLRMTDKSGVLAASSGAGAGGSIDASSSSSAYPGLSMKEVLALEREENREALAHSAGGTRRSASSSGGRRRRTAGRSRLSDGEGGAFRSSSSPAGRRSDAAANAAAEEKELSASMVAAAAAAALDGAEFLSSSSDDDDPSYGGGGGGGVNAGASDEDLGGGTGARGTYSAASSIAARRSAAVRAAAGTGVTPASSRPRAFVAGSTASALPGASSTAPAGLGLAGFAGGSSATWESRKSRSNTPQQQQHHMQSPQTARASSKSPTRVPLSARLPATSASRASQQQQQQSSSHAWSGATPSPPPTASGSASYRGAKSAKRASGPLQHSHVLHESKSSEDGGGAHGDEEDGGGASAQQQLEYLQSLSARAAQSAGMAPLAAAPPIRAARNPYSISVRQQPPHAHSHSARSRKSDTQQQQSQAQYALHTPQKHHVISSGTARPLSAQRGQPRTPAAGVSPFPQTARGHAPQQQAAPVRMHTLNPITTAAILQAAQAAQQQQDAAQEQQTDETSS